MQSAGEGPIDEAKLQQFVGRMVEDIATALRGALSYIGDKLGLFKALAEAGPVTIAELAARTQLDARYLREWLGSMTAAGYTEYDAASERYTLPREHALALADESSPFYVGGFLASIVPATSVAPKVAEAFRTGKGVAHDQFPAELWQAFERGSRGWYRHHLVQSWIPAMTETRAKLESGALALDVGCGGGHAVIALANAFPNSRFYGVDTHAESIERARANARTAGVSERVEFEAVDGAHLSSRQFDLVTTFDVIHDAPDPIGLLRSIRGALLPGGSYLMLEMNASEKVEENVNLLGRMLYSMSTLYCLSSSLGEGGPGLGACMGEKKARELASAAGFSRMDRLPIQDLFVALYQLHA